MDLQVTVTTTRKRGRWSSSSSVPLSLNQISPRVQLTQTPTSYILTVHLAGFKRDEIKLEMGKTKTIIVKAQRHVDGVGEVNWTWHIMDSDKSSSTPSKKPFQIPANVDVSKISTTFQNEVLTIVMPLIEDTQHAAPSPLPLEPAPISEDQQEKKRLDKDLASDSGVVHDGDGEEKKQGLADGQERNKEIEQQQQQSTLSEREKEEENLGSSLSKDEPLYSSSSVLHEDVEKSKQCIEDEKESPKEEKEDIQHMEKQESAANENSNTERKVEENKAKVLFDEEKQKQLCDEEKLENEHKSFVEGKEASSPSSRMAMADDGKSIMEECESDNRTPVDRTSSDFKWKEQLSLERIREGMSKNTRALVICGGIFAVGVLVACHRKLRRP